MAAENSPTPEAGEREFVISRVFDAPRALVFSAWTDPKHMARWWGPHTFTNPVCELDVRPGGSYLIAMRSTEGVSYPMKGVYREILEPERLVMTVDLSDHPAAWHDLVKPNRGKDEINPAGNILMTATFADVDGKTKLTVRMRFASSAIRDAMLKMGMTEGWSQSLERLATLLAKVRS